MKLLDFDVGLGKHIASLLTHPSDSVEWDTNKGDMEAKCDLVTICSLELLALGMSAISTMFLYLS